MRNLTLTIQFCDISQSFVSATKYENTSTSFWSDNSMTTAANKFVQRSVKSMFGVALKTRICRTERIYIN
jgi:hypothetical protein